jgi:hypothetical protein
MSKKRTRTVEDGARRYSERHHPTPARERKYAPGATVTPIERGRRLYAARRGNASARAAIEADRHEADNLGGDAA